MGEGLKRQKAQSLIENVILIGIVTIALFAMAVGIQRGIQSVVKSTADQVGVQRDAEQTFDERRGYLQNVKAKTTVNTEKKINEQQGGAFSYDYNDTITVDSNTTVNLGTRDSP